MIDRNYKIIEVGKKAIAQSFGHYLDVEIYDLNNYEVFFKTINPKTGQPKTGWFNSIEAKRYLAIK
jgi:hypothetical protein